VRANQTKRGGWQRDGAASCIGAKNRSAGVPKMKRRVVMENDISTRSRNKKALIVY
jgi:hypothetical protein